MRIWVDITDASAVVFFAPIVRRLEDAGHTVTLTARRFAGADLVLQRYGLGGVLTTQHRGGGLGTRAVGLVNRTAQLIGSASSGRFDVAAGSHASDFVLTAWTLAVPQMTVLDPDRLGRSNLVNVRLVDEVAVPEAVPVAGLAALGATTRQALPLPRVQGGVLPPRRPAGPGGARPARRRAPAHRRRGAAGGADMRAAGGRARAGRRGPALVDLLAGARRTAATSPWWSSPATRTSDGACSRPASPACIVPEGPVDGVGLMAAADFVVGAGGAMLREAAALGTPAYTLSPLGRPGRGLTARPTAA